MNELTEQDIMMICGVCARHLKELTQKAGNTLDDKSLQRMDLLAHTLKSMKCLEDMRSDDEGGEYSGRRMRSARTGRWYSGDNGGGGNSMNSYGDGGNSMNSGASYGNSYGNSYGGGQQDMARKLHEMASMLEQQNGN